MKHDEFVMLRRMSVALGTFVSFEVLAPAQAASASGNSPQGLLDLGRTAIETVERLMHPTRAGSDLAAIAAAPVGTSIPIHPWTHQVLTLAQDFWRRSGGLFDPCVPELPGRFGSLDLSTPGVVVRHGPALALDLGGIAKGFAVDRAIEALRDAGGVSGQVNAGGDVRVFGDVESLIHVRLGGELHRVGAVSTTLALRNEALAVSEPRSAGSPPEHRGFYSPLTSQLVPGRAVAVRAPLLAVADALTKCTMLCSPEVLRTLLDHYAAQVIELDQQ